MLKINQSLNSLSILTLAEENSFVTDCIFEAVVVKPRDRINFSHRYSFLTNLFLVTILLCPSVEMENYYVNQLKVETGQIKDHKICHTYIALQAQKISDDKD